MTTAARDAVLQEIIDHHEIKKLLATYCHGCDRADGPLLASTYAEDSWDNHGIYVGPGGPPFAARLTKRLGGTPMRYHHILGQSLIKVTGDEAGAETYFFCTIVDVDKGGKEVVTFMGGRYVDVVARENGAWKIKNRTCIRDWSKTIEGGSDHLADFNFVLGEKSQQDRSYEVLGLKHGGYVVGAPTPA
jgi:hypothetical protein